VSHVHTVVMISLLLSSKVKYTTSQLTSHTCKMDSGRQCDVSHIGLSILIAFPGNSVTMSWGCGYSWWYCHSVLCKRQVEFCVCVLKMLFMR